MIGDLEDWERQHDTIAGILRWLGACAVMGLVCWALGWGVVKHLETSKERRASLQAHLTVCDHVPDEAYPGCRARALDSYSYEKD